MIEFRMPSFEAGMEAGTLVEWFKQPGDQVRCGETIALVATRKGAIEIEVFDDGVIGEQRVQPGREVPVGTVLATIFGVDEREPPRRGARPVRTKERRPYNRRVSVREALLAPSRVVRRMPAGRQSAAEHCLSPRHASTEPFDAHGTPEVPSGYRKGTPKKVARRDLDDMRKAASAAMARSHSDIPHYWVVQAIDATPLFDWLEAQNALRPNQRRLLYVAPLMKAVAVALKDVPELNGHFDDDVFRPSPAVHLGFVTSLRGGGVVAPAIHDADTRSVDELMGAIADLAQRARHGRLRGPEMTDGTVTLSDVGEGSAGSVFPLIHPPQVAVVGCGAASRRPWVVGDTVAIRRVIEVTLAGDHRVSHSRHAARFLSRLSELVARPEAL